jgi:hypothetical protein
VRRARAAGVVLLLAVCLAPGTAHATEVSATELRELARQAGDSSESLEDLRAVTSVDGQPVDLDAALDGARGEELDQRLEALADQPAQRGELRNPRADAREILEQDRFHGNEVPGPFRGILDRLKDLVPRGILDRLDDLIPGGRSVVWIVLGTLLFGAGYLVSRLFLSRRIRDSDATAMALTPAELDPKTLERQADAAEASGDLEAALRLRFRAGLLRLDRRGAIEFRPSISTHEVRRAVRSEDFDALAATFDDVVYGGRAPESADVQEARERWPEVVK